VFTRLIIPDVFILDAFAEKREGGVRVLAVMNEKRTRNDSHAPHPFEYLKRKIYRGRRVTMTLGPLNLHPPHIATFDIPFRGNKFITNFAFSVLINREGCEAGK
jgi:hypothetical protein